MKKHLAIIGLALSLFLSACSTPSNSENSENAEAKESTYQTDSIATFAGGCFWCMEPPFEALEGVGDVISGYAEGTQEDATYRKVSTGKTTHREAVQVPYDSSIVDYQTLLDTYFRQIDPTDGGGQFSDRGFRYTAAIYYHNEEQRIQANEARTALAKMGKFEKPITTVVLPFSTFFPAEEYHQDFYKKSSDHYERYAKGSGRKDFIEENWAKEAALEFSR